MPRPLLPTLALAILAVVVACLVVEWVGDALRRRHLRVSGEKAAWLAKAESVAAAVRALPRAAWALRRSALLRPSRLRAALWRLCTHTR